MSGAKVGIPSSVTDSPPGPDDIGSRPVPGFGGPTSDERTSDGQSALRLHAGIAVIATVLCAFVTGIFVWLDTIPLAIVFAVLHRGLRRGTRLGPCSAGAAVPGRVDLGLTGVRRTTESRTATVGRGRPEGAARRSRSGQLTRSDRRRSHSLTHAEAQ